MLQVAHKEPYLRIERTPEKQIDLLIVVNQMLTGFDSKWLNTLYMDKVPDKPFGTIRYSRFAKYLKTIKQYGIDNEQIQQTLEELHKSFATLTQEEQKFANIFLNDVQRGDATIESGNTFREKITEYQAKAKNAEIYHISNLLGLDETKLRNMMNSGISEANINEYGRFDDLKQTVDKNKAKEYFEKLEGATISLKVVNMKVYNLLQRFIISGGFEI